MTIYLSFLISLSPYVYRFLLAEDEKCDGGADMRREGEKGRLHIPTNDVLFYPDQSSIQTVLLFILS